MKVYISLNNPMIFLFICQSSLLYTNTYIGFTSIYLYIIYAKLRSLYRSPNIVRVDGWMERRKTSGPFVLEVGEEEL